MWPVVKILAKEMSVVFWGEILGKYLKQATDTERYYFKHIHTQRSDKTINILLLGYNNSKKAWSGEHKHLIYDSDQGVSKLNNKAENFC